MNLATFRMTVAYISMAIFFTIPMIRTLMGSPLDITELLISFAIAIGFGIYATTELQKYDERQKQKKLQPITEFQEYKEGELNAKCPKCNSKLVEITNLTKKFTLNSYKGLVYCTKCDFEISKNEFDREYL